MHVKYVEWCSCCVDRVPGSVEVQMFWKKLKSCWSLVSLPRTWKLRGECHSKWSVYKYWCCENTCFDDGVSVSISSRQIPALYKTRHYCVANMIGMSWHVSCCLSVPGPCANSRASSAGVGRCHPVWFALQGEELLCVRRCQQGATDQRSRER